jgi:hypothetical protein
MFCEAATMQLSAANLLIASQQLARGAAKPAPDAQAKFAAAPAGEKGLESAGFEPMDFKQAAPAKPAAATPAPAPTNGYGAAASLGANLDIRV